MAAVGLAKRRLHPVHTRLRTETAREEKKGLLGGGEDREIGEVPEACPGQEGQTARSQGHFNRRWPKTHRQTRSKTGGWGGGRRRSRGARTTHQRLNAERLHLWMGSHVAAWPPSASSLQGDKQPDCEGAAQNIRQPLPRHPSMFATACRNGGGHFPGNIQQEPAWKEPTMWRIWLSREAPLEMPTWLRSFQPPHAAPRNPAPPERWRAAPHRSKQRHQSTPSVASEGFPPSDLTAFPINILWKFKLSRNLNPTVTAQKSRQSNADIKADFGGPGQSSGRSRLDGNAEPRGGGAE